MSGWRDDVAVDGFGRCRRGQDRGVGVEGAGAAGTVTGVVASAEQSARTEGRGAGTCRRGSQGRLWASRCGRGHRGGRGEVRLPLRRRPRDGRGGREARWLWPRRKAARMPLRMSPRPDGFRGCVLRTRLRGGRRSGAAAACEASGRSAEDVAFSWTRLAAERRLGMSFADEAARGEGGEWGLSPADEATGRPWRSLPP